MFCLGLFLVCNGRSSGEILLLLHDERTVARPYIGILFELSVSTVYVCERAMLNMITDRNAVCVYVCLNIMCLCLWIYGHAGQEVCWER